MAAAVWNLRRRAVAHTPRLEAWMIALAVAHGALLCLAPVIPVIALGVWWNANTISHNFIHRPFFRSPWANRIFGAYLSLLLGIPQALWRDRHLAHHAGTYRPIRLTPAIFFHTALVIGLWVAIAALAPRFFVLVYLPGYLAGLCLCAAQGYYEHAHGTTSHYGAAYNKLFFNDGYHAEHHAHPGARWTDLPAHLEPAAHVSRWPPVLRWMDAVSLETLERLVLRSPGLRRYVLRVHEDAFRKLASALPRVDRAAIVGGGVFPRTALILARLLPEAELTIIDASPANLELARQFLGRRASHIEMVNARYPQNGPAFCDLLVIPLSFVGDRTAIYERPPAPAVMVHDWIWRPRGESRIISIWLLKRINLVRQQ